MSPTVLLRITSFLGRHATAIGLVCGGALTTLLLSGVAGVAIQSKVTDIDTGHQQILKEMQNTQTEVSKLLTLLNQELTPNCQPETVNRLRALQFLYQPAMAIGVLDEQGRLFCSSGSGLLPQPLPPAGMAIDGSIGRYLLNTPIDRFNQWITDDLQTTVVQRGRFQVALDLRRNSDNLERFTHTLWAGPIGQRRLVFKSNDDRSQDTDSPLLPDVPHVRWDWGRGVLLVTNSVPGVSPINTQSVVLPHDIYKHPVALLAVLGMGLLIGAMASSVVRNQCRRFLSIDFRIRHLCQASNVVCHYQPIVALQTGRIVGCEVLARLQDGDTLLYPDQFIPALQRQQRTGVFDALVCQRALTDLGAAITPADGCFAVALNFFPQNLQRDQLHPLLHAALEAAQFPKLEVHLEVTEYDFSEHLVPELRRLQADGYAISIDDFGTGYSNLGAVKHIAPNYLKIDKSFVFEMEDTTIRSTLIPEIIGIAKAIGSEVIAEGIETQAQAVRLRALGVQYGQGYYFSRPVTLDKLLGLMRSDSPAAASA